MIRALTPDDNREVMAFLEGDKELNVYLIADIEHFGFTGKGQKRYGQFSAGKLTAIASKNYRYATFYQPHDALDLAWIAIIQSWDIAFLSAEMRILEMFKPYFDWHLDRMIYSCSEDFERDPSMDYRYVKELNTSEDAHRIYHFLRSIAELYSVQAQSEEDYVRYLLNNTGECGTTVFIDHDDRVIASASAVLESSDQVMIVGVAVDPNFRRHGYGKVVMHYLMDLYTQHKNKRVCLYYDDPRAEKLYWQYGFKSHGRWGMLVKLDD